MNLLIDTHVFLWMMTDRGRLSPTALSALSDAANTRWVSAVVAWKIAIKVSIKKLDLKDPLPFFISDGIRQAKAVELPITANHAVAVAELPHHHTDPFDRLLVAQARVESLSLVTADQKIAMYGAPIVW
jgi:PIN domain nuclease of toxin-antitoxin system